MRFRRLALVSLVACSSSPPPVAPAAPPPAPVVAAPVAAAPVAPPAAKPEVVAPTERSPADQQREAARAPLAAAMVDAYANHAGLFSSLVARWSPDGKQIVFGSTRDGLPELYVADPAKPAAPPLALTRGPERAISAQFTRDGKSIVFLRDASNDENHAIWRIDRDGQHLVNLTPAPGLRRGEPQLPPGKPDVMLYSLGSSKSTETSLVIQPLAGGEARTVHTQQLPGDVADVTDDGARALFTEDRSSEDSTLFEIDVASGQAHRVYPPEGTHVGMYSARYAADGKRVFVATDDGDRVVLLALDAATGKELLRYRDKVATAGLSVEVSPKGDLLALYVDAGNHGEVRILDAKTLTKRRDVQLLLGQVALGSFRADGGAFSVMLSLPSQPPDVFAVDPRSGKVTPLRQDARAGLEQLPPLEVSIQQARAFDGLAIPINVYLPKRPAGKKLPTLAVFHGGPSSSYAVRWSPLTRFFSALGYAIVEPNVRGSSGFGRAYELADNREKRADWLQDVKTVNAWVKAQPWCDPERVVVFGGSYGGYTTLMAVTRQADLWRAGVDLFGIADLTQFLKTTDAGIRSFFVSEFGDLDRDAALLEQFSPMRDVDRIAHPLFVYAGQHDPRVPRTESDTIVKALRARKVPVEYMVAENEGHSLDRRDTKLELFTRVARFLEDALK
jgi:dipeptidyl aminopeptidase/acylaminoacyl peptidase